MAAAYEVLCMGVGPAGLGVGDRLRPADDLDLNITSALDAQSAGQLLSESDRWDLILCQASAFYELGIDRALEQHGAALNASLILIRAPSSQLSPAEGAARGAADVVTQGDCEHLHVVIGRELATCHARRAAAASLGRALPKTLAFGLGSAEAERREAQAASSAEQDSESAEREASAMEDQRIKTLIEGGGLTLEYQPIVPLRHNGSKAAKFETLLRLRDTNGELLQPRQFFPVASRNQWLGRLDVWVFRRALSVLTRIQAENSQATALFVNLSDEALAAKKSADTIVETISSAKIADGTLTVEVSRKILQEGGERLQQLRDALQAHGHGLLMERYGLNDAELLRANLQWVTHVKLDYAIIQAIAGGPSEQKAAKEAVALARDADIKTIALAVENAELLPNLYALGIDYVQGNFVSLPHEELVYPDVFHN
jgi:EAL domain-containing protein (putative c-di-GMP-specific phosphodiesterase class I)